MKTLLKENKGSRWYPRSIGSYKRSIEITGSHKYVNPLKSNFAYSMQYLEYLDKQMEELNLSSVILTMLFKTYIITALSIIEMLMEYQVKSTDNWPYDEWESVSVFKGNPKNLNGKRTLIETNIYQEIPKQYKRMSF